jgi:glucose/arabinose dehydrogenase
MKSEYFAALLLSFSAVTCVLAVLSAVRRATGRSWLRALLAFFVFLGSVAVASAAMAGRNSVVYLVQELARLDRTLSALVATGAFFGVLAVLALGGFVKTRWRGFLGVTTYAGALVCLSLLTLKEVISPHLTTPENATSPGSLLDSSVAPGFQMEVYAQLNIAPTSIALGPDGYLYVAGYGGVAYQNGVIVRLETSPQDGRVRERNVASYLNRVHGIAFHGRDLYVSRAGQFARAIQGRIIQEDTGTITRLQDLNGDGEYNYYTDIIKGLPGAQLPDGLHQNNGIIFDAEDNLYITVGAPSDHSPFTHCYAGTILRARPDGTNLTVFARGFRNPYDLVIGPDHQLFCTDNDPDLGNPGDAFFHVKEGAHYGHPYNAVGNGVTLTGVVPPLFRSPAALEGLAYAPPGSLPPGYDNAIYVAAFGGDHVNRIRLERQGDSYKATMDPFASIPQALDVVISPQGEMYVCSHSERKIYRIRAQ